MGIIDTAHQGAAALAQPAVGREPGPRRWRHPHLLRRHRARRLLLRRDQRLRWRRAADQRHRDRATRSTPPSLQDSDVQPLWISRHFDSIYSVAITEQAVYVGGHFQFIESPTSDDPWPGPRQRRLRHRPGPGRLRPRRPGGPSRPHRRRSTPTTGKALEWNPTGGSNSFEGNKAMEATSRGLFIGGDGMFQGGVRTGRVAFYDFNTVTFPAPAARHDHHRPDRGPRRRQQRAVHHHRHRPGRHRHRRPGPGPGPGPRQQPVPAGQRHRVHHLRRHRQHAQRHAGSGTGTTRTWSIPATSHHQPQPAGLGAGVHRCHRWHRRLDQGDQEDRVVQHRRPDPDDRHQRSERQHPDRRPRSR